jgi:hypothetical protein
LQLPLDKADSRSLSRYMPSSGQNRRPRTSGYLIFFVSLFSTIPFVPIVFISSTPLPPFLWLPCVFYSQYMFL